MKRRFISLAAGVATAVLLAGCATPVAEPVAGPTPTSTATPTLDLTAMPTNRFGVDCESLVSGADLTSIYGTALEFSPGFVYPEPENLALAQDGALQCRWDDPVFDSGQEGPRSELAITATVNDRETMDSIVAESGIDPNYLPVDGIGDEAWAWCYGEPSHVSCFWLIVLDDISVDLQFTPGTYSEGNLGDDVDIIPNELGSYSVIARATSTSAQLASRIVTRLASADVAPRPPARATLSECESLVDWDSVAVTVGLPLNTGDPLTSVRSYFDSPKSVWSSITRSAAGQQSVRACSAVFGLDPYDGATRVAITVVPGGAWVESSGVWLGWSSEDCHFAYAGTECEMSALMGSSAVNVKVQGAVREGVPSTVLRAFEG